MTELVIGLILAVLAFLAGTITGKAREKNRDAARAVSARRAKDALIREVTDDAEIIELLVDPDDRR
jgi:light-regulated signal transduction histidine kinase (bacteriophytochrome)